MSFWDQMIAAALASGAIAIWTRLRAKAPAWRIALSAPFFLSFVIYLLPVWFGASAGSYVAWTVPTLLMMTAAGMFTSILVMLLF